MSIAKQVAEIERDNDNRRRAMAGLIDEGRKLTADRDQWKERAEKAEVKVSGLEFAARSGLLLESERQQALEAAEKRVKELEASCQRYRQERAQDIDRLFKTEKERDAHRDRIAELEKSRPSTLEAVLEELAQDLMSFEIACLCTRKPSIDVEIEVDGYRHKQIGGIRGMGDYLAKIVCEHYPDSAFARRRREEKETPQPTPEPAPNCSESPNSSTSQPDIVAELLERYPGEWQVSFTDVVSVDGGQVCDAFSATDARALAELVNRYRRIVEAVKENPRILADLDSDKLFAALRPLVREAKG